MVGLLDGDIDAAEAMTYNEYAQVLEAVNPDTGELYSPTTSTSSPTRTSASACCRTRSGPTATGSPTTRRTRDIATRFVAASIEGWAFCRDNPEECRDIVVAAGSQLGASHQLWQMNEINKLIWPSPTGIGMINEEAWNRTVEIAHRTRRTSRAPRCSPPSRREGAYTNDIVDGGLALLGDGVDINGADFEPIEVERCQPRRRLTRYRP